MPVPLRGRGSSLEARAQFRHPSSMVRVVGLCARSRREHTPATPQPRVFAAGFAKAPTLRTREGGVALDLSSRRRGSLAQFAGLQGWDLGPVTHPMDEFTNACPTKCMTALRCAPGARQGVETQAACSCSTTCVGKEARASNVPPRGCCFPRRARPPRPPSIAAPPRRGARGRSRAHEPPQGAPPLFPPHRVV